MTPNDKELLCRLVLKFKDQSISPSEFEELEKLLEKPGGVDQFTRIIQVYTQLSESDAMAISVSEARVMDKFFWRAMADAEKEAPAVHVESDCQPKVLIDKVVYDQKRRYINKITPLSRISLLISAAAVLFIVLFVRFAPIHDYRKMVASLSRTVDARWEAVSEEPENGDTLYAGPMSLMSGFAEIRMDSGAVVIVEGPARFSLESPDQVYLQQGQLVAKIDGKGESTFMIRSPHATIVDYGTEFGVQVDQQSNTVTHVYQGRVELRSGADPLRYEQSLRLGVDQGGKADVAGHLTEEGDLADHFIRQDEFDIKLKAANGSAYHRWLEYSLHLRRDPDVAAYYTFENNQPGNYTLKNVAASSIGELNATFPELDNRKPQWEQGRFTQKSALAFDSYLRQYVEIEPDSRLCINGPITIAAWIYCESDQDGGHIVSNRLPSELSSCNYQLGYRGGEAERKQYIHLARKLGGKDDKNQINSKALPGDLKGWILVAATHDNETLKYYINGQLFDTQYWSVKHELIEAGLKIGSDFRDYDESSFNGKIDEIVILRRVMSEREIAEMYGAGKP